MPQPVIAQRSPYAVEVVAGRTYLWCACGMSKRQPFCDNAHKGTAFVPIPYKADVSATRYFCGCKRSADRPLCDGTHNRL